MVMPFPSEQCVRSASPDEGSSSPGEIDKDWRITGDDSLAEKRLLPFSGTHEKVLYAVAVVCKASDLLKNPFSSPSSGSLFSSPTVYSRDSLHSTKGGSTLTNAVRVGEPIEIGRSGWLFAAQSTTRSSMRNEPANSILPYRKRSSLGSSIGGGKEGVRAEVILSAAAGEQKPFMIVEISQSALYSLESIHQRDRQFSVGEKSEEEERETKEYDDNRIYAPFPASVGSCLAELNAYFSKDDENSSTDEVSRSVVQKPVLGRSSSSASRGGGGAGKSLRRGSESMRWSDRFLYSAYSLNSSPSHASTSPCLVPHSPAGVVPSNSRLNSALSSPRSVREDGKRSPTPQHRLAEAVNSGRSNRSLFPRIDAPFSSSGKMGKKRAEPPSREPFSTPSFSSIRNPASRTVKTVSSTVRRTPIGTGGSSCSSPPSHSPPLSSPRRTSASKEKQWAEIHYFHSTNLTHFPSTKNDSNSDDTPPHLPAALPSRENSYFSSSVDQWNANGTPSSSLETCQEQPISSSSAKTSDATPHCPVIVAVKEVASLAPQKEEKEGGPHPSLLSPFLPPKNVSFSSRRVPSPVLPLTPSLSAALASSPSTRTEKVQKPFILPSSRRLAQESATPTKSDSTFTMEEVENEETQEKGTPPLLSEETSSIASPQESVGLSSLWKPVETSGDGIRQERSGDESWLHVRRRNLSSWMLTFEQEGYEEKKSKNLVENRVDAWNEGTTTVTTPCRRVDSGREPGTTASERPPTSPVIRLARTSIKKEGTPSAEMSTVMKAEEVPLIFPTFPSVGSSILLPPKWQFTQSTQGQRHLRRDSEGSKCGETIIHGDNQQERRKGSNDSLPNRLKKKVAGEAEPKPIRVSISDEVKQRRGREKEEDLRNGRVECTTGPSFLSFPSYPSPPDCKSLVTRISTHFSSRVSHDFKKFASSNTSLSFFPSSSTHKRGQLAEGISREYSSGRFSLGEDFPFFPGRSTHRRPSFTGSAMSSSSGAPDLRSPSTRAPAVLHRDWRGITYLSCDSDENIELKEKE